MDLDGIFGGFGTAGEMSEMNTLDFGAVLHDHFDAASSDVPSWQFQKSTGKDDTILSVPAFGTSKDAGSTLRPMDNSSTTARNWGWLLEANLCLPTRESGLPQPGVRVAVVQDTYENGQLIEGRTLRGPGDCAKGDAFVVDTDGDGKFGPNDRVYKTQGFLSAVMSRDEGKLAPFGTNPLSEGLLLEYEVRKGKEKAGWMTVQQFQRAMGNQPGGTPKPIIIDGQPLKL